VLWWAKGVAINSGMRVNVTEPDVSPLQLQGPKAPDVAVALFGDWVFDLVYYQLREIETRWNSRGAGAHRVER
jgi:aminomethyltransferase